MRIIFEAGFSTGDVAKRIRSTQPTVLAISRDETEPKYSQGMYLMNMRKAIVSGRIKRENI